MIKEIPPVYLVVGQVGRWPAVRAIISDVLGGQNLVGHPDVHYSNHETLTIEASRWLRAAQTNRAWGGGRRFFVLEFAAAAEAAQHALLKTLEEPVPGHHIFLLTGSAEKILPTLRSRCCLWRLPLPALDQAAVASYERFLAAGPVERLAQLKSLWDGEAATKRAAARRWLSDLERYLAGRRPPKENWRAALKELWRVSAYLNDDAAAPRLLLEHLALVLPAGAPVLK